jgi:hypothetical protein
MKDDGGIVDAPGICGLTMAGMEFGGMDCASADDRVHTGPMSKVSTATDERLMRLLMTRPPLEIETGSWTPA